MNPKAKNTVKIHGDSSTKSSGIRRSGHEATMFNVNDHMKKEMGSVDHRTHYILGKSSAKILGESSKTSSGIRKIGQEIANMLNASQTRNQKVFISTTNVKLKNNFQALQKMSPLRIYETISSYPKTNFEAKSSVEKPGKSRKGVASPTSSQEGALIGYFDYRKQKINELETNIRNYRAESQSAKRKRVTEKCPLKLAFCGICMDKKAEAEMFKSRCSHSFCLACIGNYVAAKIRDNVIKVKCPDLVCKVLLEPQTCKPFVPSQVIDRWEAALCESSLGSKKIYCPFNDCSALLIDDGRETVTSAECPHCHRLFCAQCRVPWHSGLACKSVKQKAIDKKFSDLAAKEKWQKCPNCKFYVQKSRGCECITCRCGHRFCYICGNRWGHGHLCSVTRRNVS